jgi:Transglycosylase
LPVTLAISLIGLALVLLGLLVIYPRVGAWMVRDKLASKVATKLGRDVQLGKIEVTLGHAVIHDLDIRGPLDGDMPLIRIDRIEVSFDTMHSLIGKVEIGNVAVDGVMVTVRRGADGRDNLHDILDRLKAPAEPGGEGGTKIRPKQITVSHLRMLADDAVTGSTALVADGEATWTEQELTAEVRNVSATSINAPKATATKLAIHKLAGQPPSVTLEGGEVAVWPKLALSGIDGTVVANLAAGTSSGQYVVDLAGSYGGVPGRLWTAKGAFDAKALTASIDLEAAKFQLDKLAPILAHSAVVDYQSTSVDTTLHLDVDQLGLKFAGGFHLRGLNVGHPMIADKEVHDLDLSGQIAGTVDRTERKLELTRGDFVARNVPFSITGTVVVPRKTSTVVEEVAPVTADGSPPPPTSGPHGVKLFKLRLVIPPIDCQRVLVAIPTDMAPELAGYRMRGVFDADVQLDIDWTALDATVLDGHVGLKHCRVVDEPGTSPKHLKTEFQHDVETEKGEWVTFVVGPSNPDFVPLDEISPYLVKSIMSTEDSGFYFHHGFITSEFRTALVNDLKAGAFRQGASSITMQMVKNVLLFREKTLARKLQELFLTWHVENTLTKDRIMEIYLNVIEYGPGLYGIGPAAHRFFGKPAKDLNPVEAAFFSTILPNPKDRYKQYCQGTLTKWTSGKIERILKIMLSRDRLTQTEYDQAIATPLLFTKDDDAETEEDCLKRVRKAIKNSRPTTPGVHPETAHPDTHKPAKKH